MLDYCRHLGRGFQTMTQQSSFHSEFYTVYYPHVPIGKVECIGYCLFVRVFVQLQISPARIKLAVSNFARWFRGVLGSESPILGKFAPPEAQNRTNRHMATSIADRRQCPPLTAHSPSVTETGVYRQYLPWACVDKRSLLKTGGVLVWMSSSTEGSALK